MIFHLSLFTPPLSLDSPILVYLQARPPPGRMRAEATLMSECFIKVVWFVTSEL